MNRNPPYSLSSRGAHRGGGENQSDMLGISGESLGPGGGGGAGNQSDEQSGAAVCFKANFHFLNNDGDVDGIFLLKNSSMVRKLRQVLDQPFLFSKSPALMDKAIKIKLKKKAYVVAPKPLGIHYLLYVDPQGRMFMRKSTKRIFKVDPNCAPQLIPNDTLLEGVVVRKIVRDDRAAQNSNGRLTFVITYAYRCQGVDLLAERSIQERISTIMEQIIQPRLNTISTESEVFDLDIARSEPLSHLEEYLSKGFKDSYEYPLGSIIFHPTVTTKKLEKSIEWNENTFECTFRLIISTEGQSSGDLYAWNNFEDKEVKCATIDLTDELRTMDGCIIECRRVDYRWIFIRVLTDRNRPNMHFSRRGKLMGPPTRDFVLARVRATLANHMETD